MLNIFSDNTENHGVTYHLHLNSLFMCVCVHMHTPIVYIRKGWGFLASVFFFMFFFSRTVSQEVRVGIKKQNHFFLLQEIPVWDPEKCSLWWTHHPSGLYRCSITFFCFSPSLVFSSPAQNESQSIISLISCVIWATVPWAFLTVLGIIAALIPLNLLLRLVTFYS